ncbi:MAG TPA: VCBS repeat-containing protein [Verrucomicrobiae bacterium]|nr:VCBS repeat-containing protein [Verrucomicrobiae bacterium]
MTATLALHTALSFALDWQSNGWVRMAPLPVPSTGKTGFTLMTSAQTGLSFTNSLPIERAITNLNLMNGSGLALGDYDGDGLCDIYLCDLGGKNKLFKNLGNWRFKEVTAEAGVACPGQTSTGAVFADVNGDGWLDLLVTSMGGPNALFLNEGNGHFTNVTVAAGLESKLGSTSMALADIDGNGTLDLYVANYGVTSIIRNGGELSFAYVNGKPQIRGRYAQRIKFVGDMMFELGEPDVLYLNDGKGKFTPLPWLGEAFVDENGKKLTEVPRDQSLSVAFRDLNGDGYPDIYVCSDAFTPDRCWINDGHGHFRALPHLAWRSTSFFSMNCDFADLNRDGYDDFLVVDMLSRKHQLALTQMGNMPPQPILPGDLDTQFQMRRNTLFLSRGDGTYAEIANYAGISSSEWTWSCVFLDVDLDGWEDILISNGFFYNVDDVDTRERIKKMGTLPLEASRQTVKLFPQLRTPNLAFRNQQNLTFEEKGHDWGFDSTQIANGTALGDLDNDGDLDVVVNCLNGQALLYRNDTIAPRIGVRLKGKAPNTRGIGAKIKVLGGPVTQSQEMMSGGRYVSGDDSMRVFAAGGATNLTIEITWRAGTHTRVPNCLPNYVYEIDEAGATGSANPSPAEPAPLFRDVSSLLGHRHHEEGFDDFARQPLLPRRLSQLGPGLAWCDLDGDGREELIIGSGKGGKLAVYHNEAGKGFELVTNEAWNIPTERDQTTVLGWTLEPGVNELLVGSSNYEDGQTNGESVLRYDFRKGQVQRQPGIPGQPGSVGPLALGELAGDGRVSLFVGGRVLPGKYPQAGPSGIYTFSGSQWELDVENTKAVEQAGLVSGAVWSDLDGDGFPELILACEWGPVRVYKNDGGRLHEITSELGLADQLGWWSGVTTGDLEGNGQLAIIAANWGLNSQYRASPSHPARLFFGTWNDTPSVDLLEAQDDPELGIVPRRNLGAESAGLPFLLAAFPSYAAFASANVTNILGDKWPKTKQLRATTLASTVFLRRGKQFEGQLLPPEAQFAPAWAICVADADGDGMEDLFLSQNFFAVNSDGTRLDAGRGLWLRGIGAGKLKPMPGQESGVKVYGEQRGAAVCDYDGDGRVDLAVTQNGNETRLFHNERAMPGLRIRLKGRGGNLSGIGAQLRLIFGQRSGPVREIHAGSGYWSQDSPVQVLATPEQPNQVWVRWPGGKTATHSIPHGAKEIELDWDGSLSVIR